MALKTSGRIKMHALFAAMQSRAAFRAVASKVRIGRQCHSAAKTARGDDILHEPGQFWPGDIEGRLSAVRPWPVTPKGAIAAAF